MRTGELGLSDPPVSPPWCVSIGVCGRFALNQEQVQEVTLRFPLNLTRERTSRAVTSTKLTSV